MSLKQMIGSVLDYITRNKSVLDHNTELFNIYEGDLLSYVKRDLYNQLSFNAYKNAEHRIPPINVLSQINKKLSKIYADAPMREANSETNQELVDWYTKTGSLDSYMGDANEFFNLFKNSAVEPYIYKGKPSFRVIPSSQFLVFSDDIINPLKPTVFIKFIGDRYISKGGSTKKESVLFLYTDEEFLAINSEGDILQDYMAVNPDGVNPFGIIPFAYINRSRYHLVPIADSDTLKMVKLIPILMSDMNLGLMFQAFSIIYGIDVDSQNLKMDPSSFWNLKSDNSSGNKPQLGTIKPEIDTEKTIELIRFELDAWLQSKGIKASSGSINAENMASGVSLMIQNIDTTDAKKSQIPFFQNAEQDLWSLIAHKMHPVWAAQGLIEDRRLFSDDFEIAVKFQDQMPTVSFGDKVKQQKELLDAGLTSKRMALKAIYSDMSEDQITEMVLEIDNDQMPFILDGKDELKEPSKE